MQAVNVCLPIASEAICEVKDEPWVEPLILAGGRPCERAQGEVALVQMDGIHKVTGLGTA